MLTRTQMNPNKVSDHATSGPRGDHPRPYVFGWTHADPDPIPSEFIASRVNTATVEVRCPRGSPESRRPVILRRSGDDSARSQFERGARLVEPFVRRSVGFEESSQSFVRFTLNAGGFDATGGPDSEAARWSETFRFASMTRRAPVHSQSIADRQSRPFFTHVQVATRTWPQRSDQSVGRTGGVPSDLQCRSTKTLPMKKRPRREAEAVENAPRRTATNEGLCGKDAKFCTRGCRMRCTFGPTLSESPRGEHPRRDASRCNRLVDCHLSRRAPGRRRDRHQGNGPSVWVPRSLGRLIGLSPPCASASVWEAECTPLKHRRKQSVVEYPQQCSERYRQRTRKRPRRHRGGMATDARSRQGRDPRRCDCQFSEPAMSIRQGATKGGN